MRILIVGAGNTGRNLATKLCHMDHDVVVVDHSANQLAALDAILDVMTVLGSGSSPDVLEKAEIAKADLLIAVTSLDEANIIACQFAHAVGVSYTVARVSNTAFSHTSMLDFKQLGVDLIISQNEEVGREIHDILRHPGLNESLELFDGQLAIAGVRIRSGSPLLREPLAGLQTDPMVSRARFIAVLRGDHLILPRGDTRCELGDELYVAVKEADLAAILDWICPGRQAFGKTVLAGGGGLGLDLAQRMEEERMSAVLLERDGDRAEECSDELLKTTVFHGDASDRETLINAGVGPDTAFVAITGDEELNIISCILAHQLGAVLTLAQVTNASYVPVIQGLGLLDRVVSPHQSMVNAILHFVRGRHVKAAAQLHRAPGELLHVAVRQGHSWVGKPVHRLKMPGDCVLVSVLRNGQIHVPTGELVIQQEDQLVVFCRPEHATRVQSAFKN